MKITALALIATAAMTAPAAALDRCTPQEAKLDRNNARCDDLGFRRVTAAPDGLDVSAWARAMQSHERLVAKAIQMQDIGELRRQAIELRARSSDPQSWPDTDKWNLARVYCSTTAQELANFVDDKLKSTARGEIAAEASYKAYQEAARTCKRGVQKLK